MPTLIDINFEFRTDTPTGKDPDTFSLRLRAYHKLLWSRATGIARATLDRYYYDLVNGFDREVLTKLCDYLQIEPGDLIVKVEQGDLFSSPTDGEVRLA